MGLMNDTVFLSVQFVDPPSPEIIQELRERIMGLESLPMIEDVAIVQMPEDEADDLPSLVEDVQNIKAIVRNIQEALRGSKKEG
jgi:hypothetical protein